MSVSAAPAADEIADIAGLAGNILRTMPIIEAGAGSELTARRDEGVLFGDEDLWIGRV